MMKQYFNLKCLSILTVICFDTFGIAEEPPDICRRRTLQDTEMKNDFWETVSREVEEMTADKRFCIPWKGSCTYPRNCTDPHEDFYIPSIRYQDDMDRDHCNCDDSCSLYGDCCMDKASKAPPINYSGRIARLTCERRSGNVGILILSSCPTGGIFKNSIYEQMCLQQNISRDSHSYVLLETPVLSTATNIIYKNYYCALCNDDDEHLQQSTMTFVCNDINDNEYGITYDANVTDVLNTAKYDSSLRNWKYNLTRIRHGFDNINRTDVIEMNCYFKHPSLSDFRGRKCLLGSRAIQVRECNDTWNNVDDFEKCTAYTWLMIDHETGDIYKNPHCALCNYVNVSQPNLDCFIPRKRSPDGSKSGVTLSALFDLRMTPRKRCHLFTEIWDPLHGECIPLLSKEEIPHNSTNNSISTCPRTSLQEGLFTFLNNGAIYYSLNDRVYDEQEYHLVNDSTVLVCVMEYTSIFQDIDSYTTIVMLTISLICLALHILLYVSPKRKKTWHGRNLLCLCIALFIAQFLFLFTKEATSGYGICLTISILVHYFWLASFCWMNILSIDVWRTFSSKVSVGSINSGKIFIMYNLYAWGIPLAVVVIAIIVEFTEGIKEIRPAYVAIDGPATLCWINNRIGLLVFFFIPVGMIMIVNCILFILTTLKIMQQSRESQYASSTSQSLRKENKNQQKSVNNRHKIRFALYLKLGLLQGLTWITGFIACFIDTPVVWIIFTVINGLGGAIIFFIFDFKKQHLLSICQKMSEGKKMIYSSDTNTTSLHDTATDTIREEHPLSVTVSPVEQ